MLPIEGLVNLRDYFIWSFQQRPRAFLNETVYFAYGASIYRINGDVPVKAIVQFVELVDTHRHKIQGEGDILPEIFLAEETEGGHALRLQHDFDHEYFYCYYKCPRLAA